YLKMVLEQGYWENTGLTAPSAEALWEEAELIKSLGFNGVRMHQKAESALFYYFCDLLGLYVWGEIPSNYEYSDEAKAEMLRDCPLIVKQLAPHPSVIAWVIFNESWGIPHVKNDAGTHRYVQNVCDAVKQADGQRLVISNDGWHQLESDLLTLHEYNQNAAAFAADYANKDAVVGNKLVINTFGYAFAEGFGYKNQPVLISEFGGIAINEDDGWGYGDKAANKEEFCKRLAEIFATIHGLDYLAGYCYTQITDVQQETNGLCYANRTPKVDVAKIRRIICGK
ncbi:MAG: glycoside hydrolase family 2 TIM barrel-domain containing protein, partial [Candidatus Fimimonas sp.]